MTNLPLSDAYRKAIWTGLSFQVPVVILLGLVLDLGDMAKIGACAMAGVWTGTAVVMLRRPRTPTNLDLQFIRWGYLPMVIAGHFIASAFDALRIHDSRGLFITAGHLIRLLR